MRRRPVSGQVFYLQNRVDNLEKRLEKSHARVLELERGLHKTVPVRKDELRTIARELAGLGPRAARVALEDLLSMVED